MPSIPLHALWKTNAKLPSPEVIFLTSGQFRVYGWLCDSQSLHSLRGKAYVLRGAKGNTQQEETEVGRKGHIKEPFRTGQTRGFPKVQMLHNQEAEPPEMDDSPGF